MADIASQIEEKIGLLQKTFECPICLELMKNPFTTKCDHKFCRHCILEVIGHQSTTPCPICKVPFTKRSLRKLEQWNKIVKKVADMIAAFQADTGAVFSPHRGASIPLSQSMSSTPAVLHTPVPFDVTYLISAFNEEEDNGETEKGVAHQDGECLEDKAGVAERQPEENGAGLVDEEAAVITRRRRSTTTSQARGNKVVTDVKTRHTGKWAVTQSSCSGGGESVSTNFSTARFQNETETVAACDTRTQRRDAKTKQRSECLSKTKQRPSIGEAYETELKSPKPQTAQEGRKPRNVEKLSALAAYISDGDLFTSGVSESSDVELVEVEAHEVELQDSRIDRASKGIACHEPELCQSKSNQMELDPDDPGLPERLGDSVTLVKNTGKTSASFKKTWGYKARRKQDKNGSLKSKLKPEEDTERQQTKRKKLGVEQNSQRTPDFFKGQCLIKSYGKQQYNARGRAAGLDGAGENPSHKDTRKNPAVDPPISVESTSSIHLFKEPKAVDPNCRKTRSKTRQKPDEVCKDTEKPSHTGRQLRSRSVNLPLSPKLTKFRTRSHGNVYKCDFHGNEEAKKGVAMETKIRTDSLQSGKNVVQMKHTASEKDRRVCKKKDSRKSAFKGDSSGGTTPRKPCTRRTKDNITAGSGTVRRSENSNAVSRAKLQQIRIDIDQRKSNKTSKYPSSDVIEQEKGEQSVECSPQLETKSKKEDALCTRKCVSRFEKMESPKKNKAKAMEMELVMTENIAPQNQHTKHVHEAPVDVSQQATEEKVHIWLEEIPNSVSPLLSAEAYNCKSKAMEQVLELGALGDASQVCNIAEHTQYQDDVISEIPDPGVSSQANPEMSKNKIQRDGSGNKARDADVTITVVTRKSTAINEITPTVQIAETATMGEPTVLDQQRFLRDKGSHSNQTGPADKGNNIGHLNEESKSTKAAPVGTSEAEVVPDATLYDIKPRKSSSFAQTYGRNKALVKPAGIRSRFQPKISKAICEKNKLISESDENMPTSCVLADRKVRSTSRHEYLVPKQRFLMHESDFNKALDSRSKKLVSQTALIDVTCRENTKTNSKSSEKVASGLKRKRIFKTRHTDGQDLQNEDSQCTQAPVEFIHGSPAHGHDPYAFRMSQRTPRRQRRSKPKNTARKKKLELFNSTSVQSVKKCTQKSKRRSAEENLGISHKVLQETKEISRENNNECDVQAVMETPLTVQDADKDSVVPSSHANSTASSEPVRIRGKRTSKPLTHSESQDTESASQLEELIGKISEAEDFELMLSQQFRDMEREAQTSKTDECLNTEPIRINSIQDTQAKCGIEGQAHVTAQSQGQGVSQGHPRVVIRNQSQGQQCDGHIERAKIVKEDGSSICIQIIQRGSQIEIIGDCEGEVVVSGEGFHTSQCELDNSSSDVSERTGTQTAHGHSRRSGKGDNVQRETGATGIRNNINSKTSQCDSDSKLSNSSDDDVIPPTEYTDGINSENGAKNQTKQINSESGTHNRTKQMKSESGTHNHKQINTAENASDNRNALNSNGSPYRVVRELEQRGQLNGKVDKVGLVIYKPVDEPVDRVESHEPVDRVEMSGGGADDVEKKGLIRANDKKEDKGGGVGQKRGTDEELKTLEEQGVGDRHEIHMKPSLDEEEVLRGTQQTGEGLGTREKPRSGDELGTRETSRSGEELGTCEEARSAEELETCDNPKSGEELGTCEKPGSDEELGTCEEARFDEELGTCEKPESVEQLGSCEKSQSGEVDGACEVKGLHEESRAEEVRGANEKQGAGVDQEEPTDNHETGDDHTDNAVGEFATESKTGVSKWSMDNVTDETNIMDEREGDAGGCMGDQSTRGHGEVIPEIGGSSTNHNDVAAKGKSFITAQDSEPNQAVVPVSEGDHCGKSAGRSNRSMRTVPARRHVRRAWRGVALMSHDLCHARRRRGRLHVVTETRSVRKPISKKNRLSKTIPEQTIEDTAENADITDMSDEKQTTGENRGDESSQSGDRPKNQASAPLTNDIARSEDTDFRKNPLDSHVDRECLGHSSIQGHPKKQLSAQRKTFSLSHHDSPPKPAKPVVTETMEFNEIIAEAARMINPEQFENKEDQLESIPEQEHGGFGNVEVLDNSQTSGNDLPSGVEPKLCEFEFVSPKDAKIEANSKKSQSNNGLEKECLLNDVDNKNKNSEENTCGNNLKTSDKEKSKGLQNKTDRASKRAKKLKPVNVEPATDIMLTPGHGTVSPESVVGATPDASQDNRVNVIPLPNMGQRASVLLDTRNRLHKDSSERNAVKDVPSSVEMFSNITPPQECDNKNLVNDENKAKSVSDSCNTEESVSLLQPAVALNQAEQQSHAQRGSSRKLSGKQNRTQEEKFQNSPNPAEVFRGNGAVQRDDKSQFSQLSNSKTASFSFHDGSPQDIFASEFCTAGIPAVSSHGLACEEEGVENTNKSPANSQNSFTASRPNEKQTLTDTWQKSDEGSTAMQTFPFEIKGCGEEMDADEATEDDSCKTGPFIAQEKQIERLHVEPSLEGQSAYEIYQNGDYTSLSTCQDMSASGALTGVRGVSGGSGTSGSSSEQSEPSGYVKARRRSAKRKSSEAAEIDDAPVEQNRRKKRYKCAKERAVNQSDKPIKNSARANTSMPINSESVKENNIGLNRCEMTLQDDKVDCVEETFERSENDNQSSAGQMKTSGRKRTSDKRRSGGLSLVVASEESIGNKQVNSDENEEQEKCLSTNEDICDAGVEETGVRTDEEEKYRKSYFTAKPTCDIKDSYSDTDSESARSFPRRKKIRLRRCIIRSPLVVSDPDVTTNNRAFKDGRGGSAKPEVGVVISGGDDTDEDEGGENLPEVNLDEVVAVEAQLKPTAPNDVVTVEESEERGQDFASPVESLASLKSLGSTSDDEELPGCGKKRRRSVPLSDSEPDEFDAESTRSRAMNVTSSSAFSSQSEAINSQTKGELESDVIHLEDEIAALEAELEGNTAQASVRNSPKDIGITKDTDIDTYDPSMTSGDLILDQSKARLGRVITSSPKRQSDFSVIDDIINSRTLDAESQKSQQNSHGIVKSSPKNIAESAENNPEMEGILADVSFESDDDMFGPSQPSNFQILGKKSTPKGSQKYVTVVRDAAYCGNSSVIEETPNNDPNGDNLESRTGSGVGVTLDSERSQASGHRQVSNQTAEQSASLFTAKGRLCSDDIVASPLSPTPPSDASIPEISDQPANASQSQDKSKKNRELVGLKSSSKRQKSSRAPHDGNGLVTSQFERKNHEKETKPKQGAIDEDAVCETEAAVIVEETGFENHQVCGKTPGRNAAEHKSKTVLQAKSSDSTEIEMHKHSGSPGCVSGTSRLSKASDKSSSNSKVSPSFILTSTQPDSKGDISVTPRRQALRMIQRSSVTPKTESMVVRQSGPVIGERSQLWSPGLSSGMFPAKPFWTFCSTGISKIIHKPYVDKLVELLGCKMTSKYNPTVTHVLVKPADTNGRLCARTLKYFQGIAGKAWIVSVQWCVDSLMQERLLPEACYEIVGDTLRGENIHHAPERARESDELLLANFEICCFGSFELLQVCELREVAELCGASTVEQPTLFTFSTNKTPVVVVEQNRARDIPKLAKIHKMCAVPVVAKEWLLDTVGEYEIKDLQKYSVIPGTS